MSLLKWKITDRLNKLCGYQECPVVNGKKFDVVIGACTIDDAFVTAKAMGGEFAYPETLEEMQAVQKMVIERYGCHDVSFWLAFTDCVHEGVWVFDRNPKEGEEYDACYGPYTEVPYELPWSVGEPNNSNGNEHWVEMWSVDGTLNDTFHTTTPSRSQLPYGFIIQYKV